MTDYVRAEMNRADRFAGEGEGQRKVNVGFALMTLQRRLASSPESIFKSLTRRHERLESRLREQRLLLRGTTTELELKDSVLDDVDENTWEDSYDEAPQDEREDLEGQLVDNATAAATIEELEKEIVRLKELEELARAVDENRRDWRLHPGVPVRAAEEMAVRLCVDEPESDCRRNRRHHTRSR